MMRPALTPEARENQLVSLAVDLAENPIKQQDILLRTDLVLNPEYLIATTLSTHNAIHYGDG